MTNGTLRVPLGTYGALRVEETITSNPPQNIRECPVLVEWTPTLHLLHVVVLD